VANLAVVEALAFFFLRIHSLFSFTRYVDVETAGTDVDVAAAAPITNATATAPARTFLL